ncbi:MAG TPA: response regulator [Candidatus Hydrogenedentes bacterium]|nr:response regulator [Candidatus Hydrogenedentota bacterium]
MARLLQRALAQFGYDATSVTSSVDALTTFRAHPDLFDAVITDQMMPAITGEELAADLLSIRPGLPVIMTSGLSENMPPQKMSECGISAFLLKPTSTLTLAKTVRQVLDARKGRV